MVLAFERDSPLQASWSPLARLRAIRDYRLGVARTVRDLLRRPSPPGEPFSVIDIGAMLSDPDELDRLVGWGAIMHLVGMPDDTLLAVSEADLAALDPEWTQGAGAFALVGCQNTVTRHRTLVAALAAKATIDGSACGGRCLRDHPIVEVRP